MERTEAGGDAQDSAQEAAGAALLRDGQIKVNKSPAIRKLLVEEKDLGVTI